MSFARRTKTKDLEHSEQAFAELAYSAKWLGKKMREFWRPSLPSLALACVAACTSLTARAQEGAAVVLPEVVISTTPVPGAPGTGINKVPDNVSVVTSEQFVQRFSPAVADAITSHVPGAIALDIDGSDLSPNLLIRGYEASRVTGTPIGLAVYENGVRINERFGDNVNLDLIPPITIARADVYTANPLFGLNALGGAINFITKNGFTFQGGDATIYGGSFGRVNGNLEYGKQSGNWAFYFAGDGYKDDGYRPFGAQNAERFLGDLGYRTPDAELHLIAIFGRSLLGVQGVTPQVLVNQQYNSVFTTPQTTNNQAGTAQGTLRVDLPRNWVSNSNVYIRQFDQFHVDGNDAQVIDCSDIGDGLTAPGTLCLSPNNAPNGATSTALQFIKNGQPVPSMGPGVTSAFPYGTTAETTTHTTAAGLQQQFTNTTKILDHDNTFIVGGSIDASTTHFSSQTVLGQLNSSFQNILSGFPGGGDVLNTAGNIGFNSVFISSTREDYGIFLLDTFNLTKKLAITAGARYNLSNVGTRDLTGTDPGDNAMNSYERINPTIGVTYEFSKALTIFGNYAETNRAPTPLETNCANPAQPCLLETALISDPPLQQVVARTYEAGGRGTVTPPIVGGVISYKADYFHSAASNDIVTQISPITGFGYFANVPETLRQGVEAEFDYMKGPFTFYANYAFVDATYQFTGQLSSPNNPNPAVMNNPAGAGIENITPGNHIPGIPRNIVKLGFEYKVTPKFLVGSDIVVVGSQYFVGDDNNLNVKRPEYYFINVHAQYDVTNRFQVFGFINNVTDNHYATTGSYFNTGTDAARVNATLAANAASANPNANAITVAQPISFYGGIKIKF